METIPFKEFKKLDLRIGRVLTAEFVEGSEKLLKLRVDLGEGDLPAGRQIIAGIRKTHDADKLVGREIVIVANLEPRKLMGLESQGMLLAADIGDGTVLLVPETEAPPGSQIR